MARLLALIGGMEAFVKPGQSVLVKPNLLSDCTPDEAVTTHPEVVRAVVRAVKQAGAKPWVADSPSNAVHLQRVWEKTGMEAICRAEDVPLVNLEKGGSEEFETRGIRFRIAKAVLQADAIVSLPKVKTHVLTGLTAGVKNMYGAVPGFQKTSLHKDYPRRDDFADLLVAVYSRAKPVLSIADGVVGMEGNGPSGGTPVALHFLAASDDAVALDVVVARLLAWSSTACPALPRPAAGMPARPMSRASPSSANAWRAWRRTNSGFLGRSRRSGSRRGLPGCSFQCCGTVLHSPASACSAASACGPVPWVRSRSKPANGPCWPPGNASPVAVAMRCARPAPSR